MRLVHAALVSRSLLNADRFFEQILGLQKVKQTTLPKDLTQKVFNRPLECRALVYSGSGFAIEVFVSDAVKPPTDPLEHLCLEIEDRDDFLERCRAAGLPVKRVPKGDSFLVFIEDFDGNLYEIKEKTD